MALYFPAASRETLQRMCRPECPEREKKYVDDGSTEAEQFIRRDF